MPRGGKRRRKGRNEDDNRPRKRRNVNSKSAAASDGPCLTCSSSDCQNVYSIENLLETWEFTQDLIEEIKQGSEDFVCPDCYFAPVCQRVDDLLQHKKKEDILKNKMWKGVEWDEESGNRRNSKSLMNDFVEYAKFHTRSGNWLPVGFAIDAGNKLTDLRVDHIKRAYEKLWAKLEGGDYQRKRKQSQRKKPSEEDDEKEGEEKEEDERQKRRKKPTLDKLQSSKIRCRPKIIFRNNMLLSYKRIKGGGSRNKLALLEKNALAAYIPENNESVLHMSFSQYHERSQESDEALPDDLFNEICSKLPKLKKNVTSEASHYVKLMNDYIKNPNPEVLERIIPEVQLTQNKKAPSKIPKERFIHFRIPKVDARKAGRKGIKEIVAKVMETTIEDLKLDLQNTLTDNVNVTITTTVRFKKDAIKEALYMAFKEKEVDSFDYKYKLGTDKKAVSRSLLAGANTPVMFEVKDVKEALKNLFPKTVGDTISFEQIVQRVEGELEKDIGEKRIFVILLTMLNEWNGKLALDRLGVDPMAFQIRNHNNPSEIIQVA